MLVQPNKAIVGSNAFAHESGIHQDGVLKAANTYEIMNPASVGLSDSNLVLGKHSGRHALKKRLAFLGMKADEAKLDELYEAFKKLADRKKDIYDDDLLLLGEGEAQADKSDFIFKSLQVTSGTGIIPQCVVVLEHEGQEIKHVGTGNGAVDAIYNTMAELTKTQFNLVTYSIKAATGGTDAQGEVTVVLEYKDQRVSARGADTDVLVASAKAYLAAVNKMNHVKDRKGSLKGV
jgi:2-isopropylmalate synthase